MFAYVRFFLYLRPSRKRVPAEATFAKLSELQAFAQKTTVLQAIYIFLFKTLQIQFFCRTFAPKIFTAYDSYC